MTFPIRSSFLFLCSAAWYVHAEVPSTIAPATAAASLRDSHGIAVQADGTWKGGGADYRARFDGHGFAYEPALGKAVASTQRLSTQLVAIERGGAALALGAVRGVEHTGATLVYDRGAIDERFAVGAKGVELAYVFEQPLAGSGDLVVRLALDTTLPLLGADASSGLRFERAEGGVSIGGVTGIDADGDTVAGSIALEGGELVLRLPGAFVDAASYPLVLDPLVGTSFGVSTNGNDDTNPDAAFDATNDAYLVVWQRTFSASDIDIRGQRVSSAGALVGGAIFFNSTGVAQNPQVANVNRKQIWAVVYEQVATVLSQTQSTIELEIVDAATGAISYTTRLDVEIITDTTPVLLDPDVGGECGLDPLYLGPNDDFVVVYNDEVADQILMRHCWSDAGGVFHTSAATPLFTDVPATFTSYSEPRIARAAGVYGRLLVAVRRNSLLANATVRGLMVDVDGGTYFPAVALSNSSLSSIAEIDVDGFDRRFVAAWQGADANGNTRIQACSIDANISTGVLTIKPTVDATTSSLFINHIKPAVGYSSGKTWIGYRESNSLLGSSTFKIKGFDSGTCVACEGALTLDSGTFAANEFIAVATPTSGGAYYDDRGLAVWSVTGLGGDIHAQLLKNNAQLGSVQDLGGGCGTGGTVGFASAPSIGSSWHSPYLTGLPAGTVACFVNFAFGAPGGIACGSCVWNPFQIAYTQPIQGGNVSSPVVIPCDPQLLGVPVDVQYTSLTPPVAPCPQFPGFSISNRWRMTIGQ